MGSRMKSATRTRRRPPVRPTRGRGVDPSTGDAGTSKTGGEAAWVTKALQEVLLATYWIESTDSGEPRSTTVRFSGHRIGVTGMPHPQDSFTQEETVEGVVPGTGPAAITTRVDGVNPGEWIVTARLVNRNGAARSVKPYQASADGAGGTPTRPLWPRRTRPTPAGRPTSVTTALFPFTKAPGISRFAWAPLVILGVLIGFAVQAALLAQQHRQVEAALMVGLAALGAGIVGAKVWYIAIHHGRRYDGWCIQGLVAGTGLVAATLPLALLAMPVGTFLDATAPGLLFGMSVGRSGCFWAGCCVGRPTASRWGLWSSDRRIGTRRVPTQLWEAVWCLLIGVTALLLVVYTTPAWPGAAFVGAVAAYTLGRQFVLGFRVEARTTTRGNRLTMIAAALVLAADILISVLL